MRPHHKLAPCLAEPVQTEDSQPATYLGCRIGSDAGAAATREPHDTYVAALSRWLPTVTGRVAVSSTIRGAD